MLIRFESGSGLAVTGSLKTDTLLSVTKKTQISALIEGKRLVQHMSCLISQRLAGQFLST